MTNSELISTSCPLYFKYKPIIMHNDVKTWQPSKIVLILLPLVPLIEF